MTEPLRELLDRCGTGDGDAIAALVGRFRPWALNFARAILHDADLAEDAVQEAFVAALQHLDDLRDPNAFPGWLRQIIRTHGGRIVRQRREEPLENAGKVASQAEPVSRRLEREELRRHVREAIARLPDAGRQTTELFYLDERSCAEIAGLLRVPESTVRRRLHDSRQRLRNMLLGSVSESEPRPATPKLRTRKLRL